jgi:CheY-like chemotaxis protein
MDNPKEQCRQAGMDDVLQKPVLIDDFRAALARFHTSQYS